jgi:hypothetical protein
MMRPGRFDKLVKLVGFGKRSARNDDRRQSVRVEVGTLVSMEDR